MHWLVIFFAYTDSSDKQVYPTIKQLPRWDVLPTTDFPYNFIAVFDNSCLFQQQTATTQTGKLRPGIKYDQQDRHAKSIHDNLQTRDLSVSRRANI